MQDAIEVVSDVQHEIWSHWMKYLFSVSHHRDSGSVVVPADRVERWKRQMNTPYSELSEREKDSDREQAHKILAALAGDEQCAGSSCCEAGEHPARTESSFSLELICPSAHGCGPCKMTGARPDNHAFCISCGDRLEAKGDASA